MENPQSNRKEGSGWAYCMPAIEILIVFYVSTIKVDDSICYLDKMIVIRHNRVR